MDHFASLPLMRRIDVGMQETDRDRFHTLGPERLAGIRDARTIQGPVHFTRGEQAFVYLAGETARHQRPMLVEEEVISLRPIAAPDNVDVPRAAADNQSGLGALPF